MVLLDGAPVGGQGAPIPPGSPAVDALIAELGCVQCHADLGSRSAIRQLAPDLGHAGLRYRPGYLFEFLRNPQPVRRHIGRARMPAFALTEAEAVALTLYLGTLRGLSPSGSPPGVWPDLPPSLAGLTEKAPEVPPSSEPAHVLTNGLVCLTCHTLRGQGGTAGPEFENIAWQLNPTWIARYLVAPEQFGVPPSVMPAQFYTLTPDRRRFEALRPDADQRISEVVGSLAAAGSTRAADLGNRFSQALQAHPSATAQAGERLFRAFNCAACHRHPAFLPRTNSAPELIAEGSRAQPAWLASYLRHPTAIRRSGFQPGDGARMPDFRLREDEAAAIANHLASRQRPWPAEGLMSSNTTPSAFAHRKAQALLETKLACLGCHRLNGAGGVIGPDLSLAKSRLQPGYVYAIIAQPAIVAAHSAMPRLPLGPGVADLIARHLSHGDATLPDPAPYLSPLDYPTMPAGVEPPAPVAKVRATYLRYCASCHGPTGRGDGFNAAFVQPVRPARLFDRALLSRRPDDTLFDGIHSGGAILGRSAWMPAWGDTLSSAEIRALVRYLRELCGCEGPAWARDGNFQGPTQR